MLKSRLATLALGVLGCAGLCQAQSVTSASLTTADVLRWRDAHPEIASTVLPPEEKKSREGKVDEQVSGGKAWNDQLREAKVKAKTLEREARQAEIRASETRSIVFFADGNSLNARNEAASILTDEARLLSSQAAVARAQVSALLAEGQRRGYVEFAVSSTLPDGKANPVYFRQRYLELSQELMDAEAESRSDALRTNRYSTSVNNSYSGVGRATGGNAVPFYPNRGAGDLFFANRLYAGFAESSSEREKADSRVEELKREIEMLREEGRKAGLPPGLFR